VTKLYYINKTLHISDQKPQRLTDDCVFQWVKAY